MDRFEASPLHLQSGFRPSECLHTSGSKHDSQLSSRICDLCWGCSRARPSFERHRDSYPNECTLRVRSHLALLTFWQLSSYLRLTIYVFTAIKLSLSIYISLVWLLFFLFASFFFWFITTLFTFYCHYCRVLLSLSPRDCFFQCLFPSCIWGVKRPDGMITSYNVKDMIDCEHSRSSELDSTFFDW